MAIMDPDPSTVVSPSPALPEPHFHLAMNIDGALFSAEGPCDEVMRLFAEWKEMSGLDDSTAPVKAPFNGPSMKEVRR